MQILIALILLIALPTVCSSESYISGQERLDQIQVGIFLVGWLFQQDNVIDGVLYFLQKAPNSNLTFCEISSH